MQMRPIGGLIPVHDGARFLPAFAGFVPIEAAPDGKDVFGVVRDFGIHAAGINARWSLSVLPLAAGEHPNGDVLIWRAGLPLRMPQDYHRAMIRHL